MSMMGNPAENLPNKPPKKRIDLWWIIILIAIIIVIILCCAGYKNINRGNTQLVLSATENKINQVTQRLDQANDQLVAIQQTVNDLKKTQADQAETIKLAIDTNNQLKTELTGKQSGWLIEEAAYLARLANYSLIFQHNPSTSILLLQNTDNALAHIDNPNIINARHMIAETMVKLQSLPSVDVSGIYLQLSVLSDQVGKLPMTGEVVLKTQEIRKNGQETNSWKEALNDNIQHLSHLVVIQHRDKPVNALLSQEEYSILNIYMTMLCSHAQWAVLNRSTAVYQSSLAQITALINHYYMTTNDATSAVLSQLSKLSQQNIAPEYPSLNNIITALDQLSVTLDTKDASGERT